jgi:hypothetical protein
LGVLLALLLVSSGWAQAQNNSTTGPSPEDVDRALQQMKEAEEDNPFSGRIIRLFKSWVFLVVLAVVVVTLVIVFKVGAWLYVKGQSSTATDRFIASDPWVREHMARLQAEEGDPSDPQT